jgi:hypothetical protein
MNDKETQIARAKVAALIIKILTSTLSVQEALTAFPKDTDDKSLECAWHAIIHYEADEDMRSKDCEYAIEQDEYLEMIAQILKEGNELPGNIIASYNEYYKETYLPKKAHF